MVIGNFESYVDLHKLSFTSADWGKNVLTSLIASCN